MTARLGVLVGLVATRGLGGLLGDRRGRGPLDLPVELPFCRSLCWFSLRMFLPGGRLGPIPQRC